MKEGIIEKIEEGHGGVAEAIAEAAAIAAKDMRKNHQEVDRTTMEDESGGVKDGKGMNKVINARNLWSTCQ